MISGILLAAGAARRFGGGKLTHQFKDGVPLGLIALRNLQSVLSRIVVIMRPADEALAQMYADADVPTVVCADADLGMGHSLAAGIAHEAQAQGWIIALADMPNVMPRTIRAIADTLAKRGGIVVPYFNDERGHPVGFSASYKDELLALRGDTGARAILHAHPQAIFRLQVDDPGILQDVDTPEDLQRIR